MRIFSSSSTQGIGMQKYYQVMFSVFLKIEISDFIFGGQFRRQNLHKCLHFYFSLLKERKSSIIISWIPFLFFLPCFHIAMTEVWHAISKKEAEKSKERFSSKKLRRTLLPCHKTTLNQDKERTISSDMFQSKLKP